MALRITVSAASNKTPSFARNAFPLIIEASLEDTVEDVKRKIQAKIPKFSTSRQRLTQKSEKKALADDVKVRDVTGFTPGLELEVKDLGPQIGWKLVFVIEYAGPLLIHPFFFYLPRVFYGADVVHSELQRHCSNFLSVHRFSHGTMPFFNWPTAYIPLSLGLFLAYDLYRPVFSATSPYVQGTIRNDQLFLWTCASLWAFFELSNLSTHLHLRSLRPPGSRKRAIPTGYGFGLISCPNYFFETLAWVVICMIVWALKKHAAYKKEFGKAYPKRKAMIPFII
ncbi:3-oxo-5-alpha-steroid 4-dehydrogenase-domain-containing protein [Lentinula raphanica]|uniref:3-oxo-5-alpha-steroid 4-dehydrogenase-domain-containing protein n=1 Tax=Lentinula raphanica TaxID=153919 RepID=A0AA38UE47_9AGAR|nr:3-oxo-5-alpha-steroid 4-dehydrogenase-domain-containing protein [Lentinula raphanica]